MSKLEELKAAYEAATPGEWFKRTHPKFKSFVQAPRTNPSDPYDIEVFGDDETLYSTREADLDFVALAHKMMPLLIEAAEALSHALPIIDVHRRNALGDGDITAALIRSILDKLK